MSRFLLGLDRTMLWLARLFAVAFLLYWLNLGSEVVHSFGQEWRVRRLHHMPWHWNPHNYPGALVAILVIGLGLTWLWGLRRPHRRWQPMRLYLAVSSGFFLIVVGYIAALESILPGRFDFEIWAKALAMPGLFALFWTSFRPPRPAADLAPSPPPPDPTPDAAA